MTISEIRAMPTKVCGADLGSDWLSESALRAYHILEKVKELLAKKTAPDVVLELIAEMERKQ